MAEQLERVVVTPLADRAPDVVAAYDDYQRDLFTYLLAVTHDRGAAEDLTQEAFLRLVRESRAGRFPDHVKAWLFRVAVNLARSRGRRATVADRWRSIFASGGSTKTPEEEVLSRERGSAVRRALSALPVEARMAFLLANDGLPGQEVARIIGRSEGATRTLLWRARLAVREHMEAEERP